MSWKRGFLRAWIVISVLWIMGATWVFYDPLFGTKVNSETYYSYSVAPPHAKYLGPGDREWVAFVETKPLPVGFTDHVIRTRNYLAHLYTASSIRQADLAPAVAFVQGEVDKYQAGKDEMVRGAMPGVAVSVVLPPLILLGLGWVVGWIVAGFRRTA